MCFKEVYQQCQKVAKKAQHRQLLWLNGDTQWCYQQLQSIASVLLNVQSLGVFSKTLNNELLLCRQQITNRECQRFLGQENDTLVYDAFSGFNPDSFSILCGTLTAGGVLILVTPSSDKWLQWVDPESDNLWSQPFKREDVQKNFLSWLHSALLKDPHICRYSQQSLTVNAGHSDTENSSSFTVRAIDEQLQTVNDCAKILLNDRDTNIVLTAARGRGKSAALGLLFNAIGQQRRVWLTASDELAVQQVQKFACDSVCFYSPTQLLSDDLAVSQNAVLLIDEAASISIDLLQRLSKKFSQCVFSTTTDGYEGTGQGFKLRFIDYLATQKIDIKSYELKRPMRWALNDPVENWLNNTMLLAFRQRQKLKKALGTPCDNQYQITKIKPQQLLETPDILRGMYALLAEAHYRTTPSDLRIILDSPNMHLWVVQLNGVVSAVCLVAEEGPICRFDQDEQSLDGEQLVEAIYRGQRRPRGNLIPQILIAQEGEKAAGNLKVARVVRIATADSHRRQQLASALLQQVTNWASNNDFDYIGANFSIDQGLLAFWQQAGFSLLRIGNQQDKVTASYNALVLKATGKNDSLLQRLRATFSFKFDYQVKRSADLSLILQQMQLSQSDNNFAQHLSTHPQYRAWCYEQLECFANFYRPLESVGYIAERLLQEQSTGKPQDILLSEKQQLLEAYFIKHTAKDILYTQYSLSGYRSLVKALRSAVKAWLKQSGSIR